MLLGVEAPLRGYRPDVHASSYRRKARHGWSKSPADAGRGRHHYRWLSRPLAARGVGAPREDFRWAGIGTGRAIRLKPYKPIPRRPMPVIFFGRDLLLKAYLTDRDPVIDPPAKVARRRTQIRRVMLPVATTTSTTRIPEVLPAKRLAYAFVPCAVGHRAEDRFRICRSDKVFRWKLLRRLPP